MARSEREPRGFKYKKLTVENIKERANARGGGFDSIVKSKYKMFKVKDGKNLIRILPPTWDDPKHYGFDLWINYGIGVDNQSYLSLSKMKGEPDPLAEARRAAEKAGDKDLVKALNPRQRILMWVIDRNDEDEGPQLFAAPISLDKAIANLSFDSDTKETFFVSDPNEGNDVRFYKEGQGLKTDYPAEKIKILKTGPIHDDEGQQADWLEFIEANPLPECVQFYDYEHINMMFDGSARVERKGDPEADDEAPRRKKPAPADEDDAEEKPVRRKPVVDDDDEEDTKKPSRGKQAPDDDDDGEAAEPPRRRRVIEAADDDVEEKPRRGRISDPDEDAEAEPAPKRGKRAAEPDDDDGEDVKPRSSIRDRLQKRSRIDAED